MQYILVLNDNGPFFRVNNPDAHVGKIQWQNKNMASLREKFKIKNTMVCLLKAIEGKRTQVELRNENVIVGTIVVCDGYMNLTMRNVIFKPVKGKEARFTDFYVQGKQIRYVHIPDEVDIIKAMEYLAKGRNQYREMRGRGSRGGRNRGRGRSDPKRADESLKRGHFAFGEGRSRGPRRGQSHWHYWKLWSSRPPPWHIKYIHLLL